jgi:hypothetical protein
MHVVELIDVVLMEWLRIGLGSGFWFSAWWN